jgi:hypothetical protein
MIRQLAIAAAFALAIPTAAFACEEHDKTQASATQQQATTTASTDAKAAAPKATKSKPKASQLAAPKAAPSAAPAAPAS